MTGFVAEVRTSLWKCTVRVPNINSPTFQREQIYNTMIELIKWNGAQCAVYVVIYALICIHYDIVSCKIWRDFNATSITGFI